MLFYKGKLKRAISMHSELNNVDFDFLVAFCRSNLAARVLMELFSHRQRNNWEPTIDALQRLAKSRGYNFPEAEIRNCCKGFERANCGKLKRAYGERKSQFRWECSPIIIGKEVMKRLDG